MKKDTNLKGKQEIDSISLSNLISYHLSIVFYIKYKLSALIVCDILHQ